MSEPITDNELNTSEIAASPEGEWLCREIRRLKAREVDLLHTNNLDLEKRRALKRENERLQVLVEAARFFNDEDTNVIDGCGCPICRILGALAVIDGKKKESL